MTVTRRPNSNPSMNKISVASQTLPRRRQETMVAWLMSVPALAGLLLFLLVPFVIAFVMSFTNYSFNSPLPTRWIGVENYERLFTNSVFLHALGNNLLFAAAVVPVQTALALALALLVNRPLKRMVFFRTVFFLPVIYPMALVAVVWELIFAPGATGLMNHFLHWASFGAWNTATDFLHNSKFAMPAIIVMSIWQGVGYQMVILLAGLQTIPSSLYEAAAIDRAGPWRQFWHVTLPQLRNTLLFVVMITTILAFRLFDQIWILTQGGPNHATTTLMYESFVASRERNQVSLGAAMAVIFFVIMMVIAFGQHWLARQERKIK
jgi:multiple sugar transport system permease protein